VAAPFGFVEVDQLVVGRLGPAAWRGDIFLRELRDRGREGNVGCGIEVLTSYGLLPVQLDMSLYLWIESGRQLPSPLTRGTSSRSRIGWAYRAGHIPGLLPGPHPGVALRRSLGCRLIDVPAGRTDRTDSADNQRIGSTGEAVVRSTLAEDAAPGGLACYENRATE